MHFGSNLTTVQAFNHRIVLDAIRVYGPLSRADVARQTELSAQTISNIVGELSARDLIVVAGSRPREGGGKPSALLSINPAGGYSVGVNIYLDEVSGVLIDLAGTVHHSERHALKSPHPQTVIPLIGEMVERMLAAEPQARTRLLGAGVGLPGPLHMADGEAGKTPDYSAWHKPSTAASLESHLATPVLLENNANAAALGERWYGQGRFIADFLYVSLGMYLGGAVIKDGQIHRGVSGFAGELGDMPALAGEGGSLAEVASPAVLYAALEASGTPVATPSDLAALYMAGDPVVLEWLDTAARQLAPVLIVCEYLLDPEALIFGGRLPVVVLDALIARLEDRSARFRKRTKSYVPRFIRSDAGEAAAALGAATLPIYSSLAPHPSLLLKQPSSV
jgi:predicted NBD/HSP70 family sugar kinase